jgi:hypothetical protein
MLFMFDLQIIKVDTKTLSDDCVKRQGGEIL